MRAVGLEDNLYFRHGELAINIQLTERIERIMREMDLEPATAAESARHVNLPRGSTPRPEFAV